MMIYEQEILVDKLVIYTIQVDGQVFLIENVPARVNEETGEQFFSPSTVGRTHTFLHTLGAERAG
jgi:hypothetical protein